jgi:CRP-like cAMP-binding protein
MSRFTDPLGNHLIAALSAADSLRWASELEWTDMPLGTVLYESGTTMDYVYFPVTSIVSLVYITEGGASSEIAVVGNEGLVGVSLFMGGGSTPSRGVVQCAGEGFRMKAKALKASFDSCPEVQLLLLKYTQSLITQMSQTAVCNRHHSLEAQVCKRLLLSLDRLSSTAMMMTQELIANMLGVRREGVSAAAFRLRRDGLIRYSRGCIEVLDRLGLERRACECYGVVKRECRRLLPDAVASTESPMARAAMGLPGAALASVATSRERPARRVDGGGGKPAALRHAKPTLAPRAFEAAGRRERPADPRCQASLAGVEAFLAMSTIMSAARSPPLLVSV